MSFVRWFYSILKPPKFQIDDNIKSATTELDWSDLKKEEKV
jgi:hypothetical protein